MMSLADAKHADMKSRSGSRIPGSDLLGDEEIVQRTFLFQQLKAPIDGVVVGEGHQIHPALQGDLIHLAGRGVAISCPENGKRNKARMTRMDMEIDSNHRVPGAH